MACNTKQSMWSRPSSDKRPTPKVVGVGRRLGSPCDNAKRAGVRLGDPLGRRPRLDARGAVLRGDARRAIILREPIAVGPRLQLHRGGSTMAGRALLVGGAPTDSRLKGIPHRSGLHLRVAQASVGCGVGGRGRHLPPIASDRGIHRRFAHSGGLPGPSWEGAGRTL